MYACIRHGLKVQPEGELLGWEIACYEYGSFDSWFVNHLEKDLAEKGIRPGRYGLVKSFAQALEGAEYCGRDDVGSEPGLWQPWAVVGYEL